MDKPHIFLDLDGVLADFDQHYKNLFGVWPNSERDDTVWHNIETKVRRFYRHMPPMADAVELLTGMESRNLWPRAILTGTPWTTQVPWGQSDKVAWVHDFMILHGFAATPVICCPAKEKSRHIVAPGDILIDDRPGNGHMAMWHHAGGRWITHTGAQSTLAQLDQLRADGGW